MKDEGFSSGVEKAKSTFSTITGTVDNVMGGVVSGAAKVGAVFAGMATAGIAAFSGLSIHALQLGGELEQNLGGAEAVFGEFADTIKAKGETSFKEMGTSLSEFLGTANKMGSLFQGAGFETSTAMELTAATMQRAADVASIMGIDTSSAMESIAGAAKGNFTINISPIFKRLNNRVQVNAYQRCVA